ncbi:MAG: right-handed parallel beta-helix repeat-containing protein [Candidatus Schekmanbacteria bacterium]|nr:right-handed parallel beta-helix repeat-containing protein [Candidatus Schekmanbacteria bacterium]
MKLRTGILGICCVFSVNYASAAVLNVPQNYKSIQTALETADDGDKILVAAGTYNERINFYGKKVILESTNGAAATKLSGDKKGSVVTFSSREGTESVLKGFTITDGLAETGGGIYCQEASPTIKDCIISGNSATWGGGIYCYRQNPQILNCTIAENKAAKDGGGILCDESSPVVKDCVISKNSAGEFFGGGIFCNRGSAPLISKCRFTDNSAQFGAAIGSQSGSFRITNSILANNRAAFEGGGIFCEATTFVALHVTFFSNSAKESGGAISCDKKSGGTVVNSILWGDTAQGTANEIYLKESGLQISYSAVQGGRSGEGNISAEPKFMDLFKGDYRLKEGSPCIDKGTAAPDKNYKLPDEDMAGRKRPQGKGPDMGAFEF